LTLLPALEYATERLEVLFADQAYAGGLEALVAELYDWRVQIVHKPKNQKGFCVQAKRWIVERTFAWLGWDRRLSKEYEAHPQNSRAMILWSMTAKMLRRLHPT
jgi:transposase